MEHHECSDSASASASADDDDDGDDDSSRRRVIDGAVEQLRRRRSSEATTVLSFSNALWRNLSANGHHSPTIRFLHLVWPPPPPQMESPRLESNETLKQKRQPDSRSALMLGKSQGLNRELEKQIVDKILGEGYDKRIRPSGINNKTGQNG